MDPLEFFASDHYRRHNSIPDLGGFDIVYAYGVLYHLADPGRAIARMWAR
jgi:hypothetical protein